MWTHNPMKWNNDIPIKWNFKRDFSKGQIGNESKLRAYDSLSLLLKLSLKKSKQKFIICLNIISSMM